jgi:serine/threonine-protein kinase
MLTEPNTAGGELGHWWPQLLPDGEHVLFTAYRTGVERSLIDVVSVRTRERTTIAEGCVTGRYVASGHLLCARDGVLFAAPFDVRRLEVTGEQVAVVNDLDMIPSDGFGVFDISPTGTLVYLSASDFDAPTELIWVDREGGEASIPAPPGFYQDPTIAPNGRSLALSVAEPGQGLDVHVLDLTRGTLASITSGGGSDFGPIWNGDDLIYAGEQRVFEIHSRPADGRRPAERIVAGDVDKIPMTLSSDGRTLLYEARGPNGIELWLHSLDGSASPIRTNAPASVLAPDLSPDGHWLAYTSKESGRDEVYVASFPDPTLRRVQVSTDGGHYPLWTRGGRELVFRRGGQFLAVAFDPTSGEAGNPDVLFSGPYVTSWNMRNYDVTEDGERFVVVKHSAPDPHRRVRIVTNFFQELERIRPE